MEKIFAKIFSLKLGIIQISGLIVIRFLILLGGLLTNRWINVYLSPEEYRSFSLVSDSITSLIMAIISFGIPNLILKYFVRFDFEKDKELLANVWTTFGVLRLLTYPLALISIIIFNLWLRFPLSLTLLVFSMQFILVIDLNYRSVAYAKNRTISYFLTDLVSKLALVSILYFAVYLFGSSNIGIYEFIGISAFAYSLALILDFIIQKQYTPLGRFDFNLIKENKNSIFLLTLTSIIGFFYLTSWQTIFTYFPLTDFQVNSFTNAYNRVFLTLMTFPAIIVPAYSAKLSKQMELKNRVKIKQYSILIVSLGFLFYIVTAIFGFLVLKVIDPEGRYSDAIWILQIIAPVMLIQPVLYALSDIFIYFHKEKYQMLTACVLAIIGLSLQFILIGQFGLVGAPLAFLITMYADLAIKLLLLTRLKY